jgi:hypothetical protein
MPWFVGRTRPCSEHLAQRQIERHYGQLTAPQWNKAEHTYLPMFFDLKNRRRQCLFTSWLFIRECEPYAFLSHIEALSFILMNDGQPAVLSDAVIGHWRRGEDRRGLIRLPLRRFDAGETVRGDLPGHERLRAGRRADATFQDGGQGRDRPSGARSPLTSISSKPSIGQE